MNFANLKYILSIPFFFATTVAIGICWYAFLDEGVGLFSICVTGFCSGILIGWARHNIKTKTK